MKRDSVILISILLLSISIIFIVHLIDRDSISNIKDIKWVHYNSDTGKYDSLYISEEIDIYLSNYDININKYNYNDYNKTITFDGDISLKIVSSNDEILKTIINEEEYIFYRNFDSSFEYEFNKYYGISTSEYKNKYSQSKDIIKIDSDEGIDRGYIIYINDETCVNIECYLILGTLEKWLSVSDEVYYMNGTDSEYPVIKNISDGSITSFKCNGLDCSEYNNFIR